VNFVAHAVIAEALGCSSLEGFGSMVPDLANMVGSATGVRSAPDLPAPELQRGSQVHIATDEAFHHPPAFLSLTRVAASAMDGRRHVNTAAAHVGIELMIDGYLLSSTRAEPYPLTLHAAAPFCLGPWAELLGHLVDDNPTRHYRNLEGCAERTWRILGGRRVLAQGRPNLESLVAGLNEVASEVYEAIDGLLHDVTAGARTALGRN
jgi:hypothetical protein